MNVNHSKPGFQIPAGACDCHMHIFGTADRYPFVAGRSYTPPEASLRAYRDMTRTLGLERNVFVQGSAYGADNACLLDALSEAGTTARGVVMIDRQTTDDALRSMDKAGVCGVRVNAHSAGIRSASEIESVLRETADRIKPLGWHIQLFAALDAVAELAPVLRSLGVPVVIDHMGMAKAHRGVQQPGFRSLLDLVADGAWVKISGAYRVSEEAPDYPDAKPIAQALIDANPDRVVWGTDWPHTGKHPNASLETAPLTEYRPLDDGLLLDLLASWAEDPAIRRKILVDNPAELYGFN